MKIYLIANWGKHYENNRSRKIEDLRWVPIPNSHDGEKYTELITAPDGLAIFTAWILLLQVASRCVDRGRLMRSNGKPHDAASLSLKTRAPMEAFAKALPYLEQIGWLTSETVEPTALAPNCRSGDVLNVTQLTKKEGRKEGMEENGIEGKEGRKAPAESASDSLQREAKRTIPPSLETPEFREAWARWIAHWADQFGRGRSIPQTTADQHLGICLKLGPNIASEAINNAISRNLREPGLPFSSKPNGTNRHQTPALTDADHAKGFFHEDKT